MKWINRLALVTGKWVSWLNVILILLVCLDVMVRYIFQSTSAWIMELEWQLFAAIFLLGSMMTFYYDRHVRVDVFYNRFNLKTQSWIDLIGTLVLLLPWVWVVIFTSWKYALTSLQQQEGSPNPGGLPFIFVIKFVIVLGFLLLGIQAINRLADTIKTIRS